MQVSKGLSTGAFRVYDEATEQSQELGGALKEEAAPDAVRKPGETADTRAQEESTDTSPSRTREPFGTVVSGVFPVPSTSKAFEAAIELLNLLVPASPTVHESCLVPGLEMHGPSISPRAPFGTSGFYSCGFSL